VREEGARVVFLHRDHRGGESLHAFVEFRQALFLCGWQIGIGAGDVQIQVRINAALLELEDEIVEAVEPFRVQRPAIAREDARGRAVHVHVMEAYAIDPEFCHPGRDLLRIGMYREARAKGDIDTDEALARAPGVEVAVLRRNEIAAPGGLFEPRANVSSAGGGVIPWEDEGKQVRRGEAWEQRGEATEENKQTFHGRDASLEQRDGRVDIWD